MKKIVLILFCCFSLNAAFSQSIIFSEDFNYPSAATGDSMGGATTGYPIWQRHSGGGSIAKSVQYTTNPLTLSGYAGSGIGGAITFQHTVRSQDINGNIGTPDSVGSVYAAFLLKIDSSGGVDTLTDYFFHFFDGAGATTSSTFRQRIFVANGSTNTKFKIGMSKGSASQPSKLTAAQINAGAKLPQYASTEYNLGQTYLVVVKYMFIGTSGDKKDSLSLFVFPGLIPTTEPTPDVSFIDTAYSDLKRIASVAIREGSVGRTLGTIDGLRVFTAWDAATIALLPTPYFSSFNVLINKNETANIQWSTTKSDIALDYIIEKSLNGKEFSSIAKISPTQNSNYNFTDDVVLTTTTYYRIKFINKNGSFFYTNTLAVTPKKSIKLDVFPNPVKSNLIVSYPKTTVISNVRITTLDGKTLVNQAVQQGSTQISLDVANLQSGNYLIVFNDAEGNITTQKFVK